MTTIKRYFMLGFALAFIAVAGMMVTPLHKDQIRYDLTSSPVRGVSPDIVLLTTALGAFRGIVINVIWIRMESLKDDGKFFEIAQLAELACKLAPRFPKVWDFNAWNMAYNVSVQVPDHSERWPWIRSGIELLRNQGIPNNPDDPELYFSLGWMYKHKIGDTLDDAHFWYKQSLGMLMHEVLQGSGSRETLEALGEAPQNQDSLLQDKDTQKFYNKLLDNGFDPFRMGDRGLMRFFAYLRDPDAVPEGAMKLMEDEQNAEIVADISLFARAHRLREQLKLNPDIMIELMDEYGPLDWRNPYSHALYWGTLGRRVAVAFKNRAFRQRMRAKGMSMEEIIQMDPSQWEVPEDWVSYRYREIDYDRIIYSAMQGIVEQGRLLFDSAGRVMPMMGPDYRFTEAMIEQYELVLAEYDDGEVAPTRGIESAYRHFLRKVTLEFFYMGAISDSRRYYEKLQERFPSSNNQVPHEEFVTEELQEYISVASPDEMRRMIGGLLHQSYYNLGGDADDRAEALHARAKRYARLWNEKLNLDEEENRRRYVDFSRLRESVLLDIFSGRAGFPEEFVHVLQEKLPSNILRQVQEAAEKSDEELVPMPFDD